MDHTIIFRPEAPWRAQLSWLSHGKLMVDPEVQVTVQKSTAERAEFVFKSVLQWTLFWADYELIPYDSVFLAIKTSPRESSGVQAVCYRFWSPI